MLRNKLAEQILRRKYLASLAQGMFDEGSFESIAC